MVVIELKERDKDDSNRNGNSNGNYSTVLRGDPVPASSLGNYTVEEILQIYKHRGIAVICCQCGHKYVDKKEKDIWTFDYSICPKCMGFNSFKDYIFGNGHNTNGNRRKRMKVLISRIFGSSEELIRFLNNKRYDFPDAINVIVTIRFNSKEEVLRYFSNAAYNREIDAVIEG